MLNSLVEAFDAAAERHGVEQVRSMQDNGLLATCGLVVPRVDHASRTIAFAREVADIPHSFNDQHDAQLEIRAGIDSGPVTSGLVGNGSTIYALWVRPSTWPTGCTQRRTPRVCSSATGAAGGPRYLSLHRGGHRRR